MAIIVVGPHAILQITKTLFNKKSHLLLIVHLQPFHRSQLRRRRMHGTIILVFRQFLQTDGTIFRICRHRINRIRRRHHILDRRAVLVESKSRRMRSDCFRWSLVVD